MFHSRQKVVISGTGTTTGTELAAVGSNGKAYAAADKDNLPSGVNAVAMVAHKSSFGYGLAIALADESGKMDWATAKSTCEGKGA